MILIVHLDQLDRFLVDIDAKILKICSHMLHSFIVSSKRSSAYKYMNFLEYSFTLILWTASSLNFSTLMIDLIERISLSGITWPLNFTAYLLFFFYRTLHIIVLRCSSFKVVGRITRAFLHNSNLEIILKIGKQMSPKQKLQKLKWITEQMRL